MKFDVLTQIFKLYAPPRLQARRAFEALSPRGLFPQPVELCPSAPCLNKLFAQFDRTPTAV